MAASIRFSAIDIRTEGMEVDVELSPRWLDDSLGDAGISSAEASGRLHGRLSRSGHDIVVRGRVRASVSVACVRCLEPSVIDVNADLSLLLQPAPRSDSRRGQRSHRQGGHRQGGHRQDESAAEYEFTSAEADLDVYDGETVVLDDFVREAILLELPSFPLCRESCPGMLAGHRAVSELLEGSRADEVDPRLAPLDAFRKAQGPATIEDLVAAANERRFALTGRKPVLKSNRHRPSQRGRSPSSPDASPPSPSAASSAASSAAETDGKDGRGGKGGS